MSDYDILKAAAEKLRRQGSERMMITSPRDPRGAALWDAGCWIDPDDGNALKIPHDSVTAPEPVQTQGCAHGYSDCELGVTGGCKRPWRNCPGEPVQPQEGNQISQPTRLGEQGERDGKNSGVHRDRTRQPEDGSDRSGLPGGSGVLDRAGLDPSRGVVEGDPGRLTQEPRAGSARPEPAPPVQTQETLAGLLAKHRWNAELLYFAAESWIACGCGERIDVPIAANEANSGDVWAAYHVHVEAAVLLAGWVSPADHARALTEAWDQGWASGTMYGYDEQRYPNPFRKGDADD